LDVNGLAKAFLLGAKRYAFVTLKVDTLGQLHVLGELKKLRPTYSGCLYFTAFEDVVRIRLPLFQPAFKTNLEVPVEVGNGHFLSCSK
jgi:hypothetical protein